MIGTQIGPRRVERVPVSALGDGGVRDVAGPTTGRSRTAAVFTFGFRVGARREAARSGSRGTGVCSPRMSGPSEGFSRIRREHVEQAFRQVEREGGSAKGGSYFVKIGGKELPAKRVLRAAYRLANGVEIPASAFSGGTFTAKIFERLGIEVVVRASGV